MIDDVREVVKCEHCKLNQFRPASDLCVRCKKYLYPEQVHIPTPEPPSLPLSNHGGSITESIGAVLLRLRTRRGWSQGNLADKMGVARSYVSKTERMCINTPNWSSLERFAITFSMGLTELVAEIEDEMLRARETHSNHTAVLAYQAQNGPPA